MNEYLPFLTFVGVLTFGTAIVYIQWKLGTNKQNESAITIASEVNRTYEIQVKQLREELAVEREGRQNDRHDLKNEIQALALQLANLRGANTEKDKKIVELTEMLQGKNPEQEQYMESMREFTKGVAVYMRDSAVILAGLKDFMRNLNDKAGTNQRRNEQIDAATAKEQGHVLRNDE